MLRLHAQKLCRGDHLIALVLAEIQQVFIAADDVIRFPRKRAVQKSCYPQDQPSLSAPLDRAEWFW